MVSVCAEMAEEEPSPHCWRRRDARMAEERGEDPGERAEATGAAAAAVEAGEAREGHTAGAWLGGECHPASHASRGSCC